MNESTELMNKIEVIHDDLLNDLLPAIDTIFNSRIRIEWNNAKPPKGYLPYNSSKAYRQKGLCPNCKAEKPGTYYDEGGFQNRFVQNVYRAMKRLDNREYANWKPSYELFSVDLDTSKPKYSTMLKCHPSRYSIGKLYCCGAKIWHDFANKNQPESRFAWAYYYQPTNTATLDKWIGGK
jgi:hypothetical protein